MKKTKEKITKKAALVGNEFFTRLNEDGWTYIGVSLTTQGVRRLIAEVVWSRDFSAAAIDPAQTRNGLTRHIEVCASQGV